MAATQFKTIEFHGNKFKFSAGHFTIFSATDREPLHGHNYHLEVAMTAAIIEPGITFDYRLFKNKLMALCERLNWHTLLPTQSPYLALSEDDEYIHAVFNQKKMSFLKEDVILLPLANITLEELSDWFLAQLTAEQTFLDEHQIRALQVKVFNGPEQSASAQWVCQITFPGAAHATTHAAS